MVEWAGVACATRYNVSVFVDGADSVTTVPAAQTSFALSGLDAMKTYRIQVSSRNDAGQGASSGVFYLRPATPPVISGAKVVYEGYQGGLLKWTAPNLPDLKGCELTLKRVASQKLVREEMIDCAAGEYLLAELDAREMFVITLRAINAAGNGPMMRLVVGGDKPLPVKSLGAIRDPGDPNQVIVSWLPSDNTGRGTVIGYEIGYGHARADERVVVKGTDTEVRVPADKSVVIVVRVLTDAGKSRWSKHVRIPLPNSTKVATTDQRIDLIEQEGVVTVAATQAVANNNRLVVRISPTANNGGFTETQYSQPGAQSMTFRKVPEGSYVAVVEADGREMARRYLNIGKLGMMNAADWTVVLGKADISNQTVDLAYGGETRVFSTRPFTTQDMVLETKAHLKKGQGYGIWFRANAGPGIKASGLTVQYDPGWGNTFIIRQWHNGTECSNPIARTPFPAGMKVYDPHNIVVAAQGDTLFVTIDGEKLFNVPSLSQAIANNSCKYPAPTGTMVGLRMWGSTAATFTGTTVR
jgi:hypothetical protein